MDAVIDKRGYVWTVSRLFDIKPAERATDVPGLVWARWRLIHTLARAYTRGMIFLSYSSKNAKLAAEIKAELEEALLMLPATDDIGGGGDWYEEIWNALRRCDAFVGLVTKEFIASDLPARGWSVFYSEQGSLARAPGDARSSGTFRSVSRGQGTSC
ncbi:MAG: toll/interleukin-1 receptor domain-containing protein [Phycisphaerales bacterium]|nr:toll/interleukin-1 receptor domain-containing protein [Phycisphaerales bacterium]